MSYIGAAIGGAAIGAAAVAIPMGVGLVSGALTGAVGGTGAAVGVVGGMAAAYAALTISAPLVIVGLIVLAFLKNNFDQTHESIKFSTLIPSLLGAGVLTAAAMTGQFSDKAAEPKASATESFNGSCKKLQQIETDQGVTLVVPKGCKIQTVVPK